jgi:hypothetical protein
MRRQLSTAAIALSVIFMLGGCGEQSQGDGVASAGGATSAAPSAEAPAANLSDEDRGRRLAQCMRDNGVDVPDPDPSGGFGGAMKNIDRNSPVFQKAMDACRQWLPGGGDLSKLDPETLDQLRVFTQCLRDNGLDVPDPDPNAPGLGLGGAGTTIDRNSPVFQQAMTACRDKLPQGLGRQGGK